MTQQGKELSTEEIHDMIKTLFYSTNGFTIVFSSLFNIIATSSETKEDAFTKVELFANEICEKLDMYFGGQLSDGEIVNGVCVHGKQERNLQ